MLAVVCTIFAGWADLVSAEEVAVPGATVELQFAGTPTPALRAVARQWIADSARNVVTYYGAFPVRRVVLRITLREGHEPDGGETFGWDGALIKIDLGRAATAADLHDDWRLTHEMIHLALPNVPDRHHWLEEGLATYIESIARGRSGNLTPTQVWSELVENLPQGQPAKGDRGLDHTATWGRTYYGGALFCLRADVEIRRRTANRRGLEHALRGILAAGGSIETSWPIDRILATGDAASGVPVLREIYDQMKAAPSPVDLAALWRELGIIPQGHTVNLDDRAPLAAVRRAICPPSR